MCEVDPNKRYQRASQLNRDLKALVKKKEDEQRRREEVEIARQLKERQKADVARKKAEEKAKREAERIEAERAYNAKARTEAQFNMGSANETVKQKRAVNNAIDYGATISDRSVVAAGSPIKNKKFSFELNKRNLTVIAACAAVVVIAIALTVYFSWHNSFVYVNGERLEKDVTDLVFNDVEIDNIEALKNYNNIEDVNLRNVELTESELELVYKLFSDTDIIIDVDVCGQLFASSRKQLVFEVSSSDISFDDISKKVKYFPNLKLIDLTCCETDEEETIAFISLFPQYNVIWNIDLFGQMLNSDTKSIDLSNSENIDLSLLKNKLSYFKNLSAISLSNVNSSNDDLLMFRKAYPNLDVDWEIELFGKSYNTFNDTAMDFHGLGGVSLEEISHHMRYFENIKRIDLSNCGFSSEELLTFRNEYTDIDVDWIVNLFGKNYSTLNCTNMDLSGRSGISLEEISKNLKYFSNLKQIDLSDCGFKSETLWEFEQNNGVDVVWKVTLGGQTFKTDATELDLSGKGISDISSLAFCTELISLDLGESYDETSEGVVVYTNNIGDISALSNLTKLTKLDLRLNNIRDISPLSKLTALRELHLNDNKISDITPLSGLTQLIDLMISENNIQDLTPLKHLSNMACLDMSDNKISDISVIGNLTNLHWIYLRNNDITDISALSGLNKLDALGLSGNNISDISALAQLVELTYLDLGKNNISDISPLEELTKLDVLYLYYNNIRDISPLEKLANITDLHLGGNNHISDISSLASLTNLECLLLYENEISDISYIVGATNLVQLILYKNNIKDISPIFNLKELETLQLDRNDIQLSERRELENALPNCNITWI